MTGPDQLRAKLAKIWQLTGDEAVAILTSDEGLAQAFLIHGDLDALFQDFAVERKWMRERKPWLDDSTPVDAMVAGRGETVREWLEWVSRAAG